MTSVSTIMIRDEQPTDHRVIRSLLVSAFGGTLEAEIVDSLRGSCPEMLPFVAAEKNAVVGYLLLTPAMIDGAGGQLTGWALAPMAVHPTMQRRGIGSLLVETAVAELQQRGAPFLVVLGHPHFYPRFGFEPACRWELCSEWDVPDEAFMILALDAERLRSISGVVHYHHEFHREMPAAGTT